MVLTRSYLGIRGVDGADGLVALAGGSSSGVRVGDVDPDGPAARAGVLGATSVDADGGDVIVAVAGRPVRSMADVEEVVQRHRPGDGLALRAAPRGQAADRPGPAHRAPRLRAPRLGLRWTRDPGQDLRHHPPRGRRARDGARGVGGRLHPLGALAAGGGPGGRRGHRPRAAAPGRAGRGVRERVAGRGRPRRGRARAHATSSCTATRGRRSAPRPRGAPAARSSRPRGSRRAPTCRRSSASGPTSTCSTPPPRASTAAAGSRGTGSWRRTGARRSPRSCPAA